MWSPKQSGTKLTDPHVVTHDHDVVSRKFGHEVRDIGKEDAALVADLLAQTARNAKPTPAPKPTVTPPRPKKRAR